MIERAKELFIAYGGNRFYMDHDGVGEEYAAYRVTKETEERWADEFVRDFLEAERHGKDALKDYRTAAELLRTKRLNGYLKSCLLYPIRARHLDDVTRLFMLQTSYLMAETAAKKGGLSREEIETYLQELDIFSGMIKARAENSALTRAEDFVMNEFADFEYTAGYLDDLRQKWLGLR